MTTIEFGLKTGESQEPLRRRVVLAAVFITVGMLLASMAVAHDPGTRGRKRSA